MTAGKCCLEGRKVEGTPEGLHYDETIWNTMSREQRDQAKSTLRAATVAMTSPPAAPLSEVSDKVES